MSDEERLATLADLTQAKKATTDQLERMPVSIRSQRVIEQKRELEEKINRLEKAIATFSKPKVFVAI